MKDWLRFIAVILGWTLAGRAVLELSVVHPLALALVWFVGLIWLIGWVVGSVGEADYLLKIMAGMVSAPLLLAGVIMLAQHVVN